MQQNEPELAEVMSMTSVEEGGAVTPVPGSPASPSLPSPPPSPKDSAAMSLTSLEQEDPSPQPGLECPCGHILVLVQISAQHVERWGPDWEDKTTCDRCHQEIPLGAGCWSCHECGWDACDTCMGHT